MKTKLMEIVQQEEYISLDDIQKGLCSNYIQDYCYILHDKDIAEDGTKKASHYHIYIRLKDSTDSKYIAKAFNVKEQYINKVKGKWVDVLLYATHKNRPEKHQYADDEVISNFDFVKVRDAEEEKKKSNSRLEEIIKQIADGTIREYNYYNYITIEEKIKYNKQIDIAFKYRQDCIIGKGGHRNMEVIYIQGASGTGKTTYSKMLAEQKEYSYYISSSSNDILGDYKGQDCLILDDLRPSCMGLSDLLKMLDNHTTSTVKSRYKNKFLECKLIIITSILPIDDFFRNVFSEEQEPIIQLKRRCKTMLIFRDDIIDVYCYSIQKKDYSLKGEIENPINPIVIQKQEEEEKEAIENLLGAKLKIADCPF